MTSAARISLFAIFALFSSNTHAAATCFCDVSTENLNGASSPNGVIMSLTGKIGLSFTGLFQQSEANQLFCQATCKATAEAIGKPAIVNATCTAQAAKAASGLVPVLAYSKVGIRPYRIAADFGEVLYKPEVKKMTCICPTGWLSNSSNAPKATLNKPSIPASRSDAGHHIGLKQRNVKFRQSDANFHSISLPQSGISRTPDTITPRTVAASNTDSPAQAPRTRASRSLPGRDSAPS